MTGRNGHGPKEAGGSATFRKAKREKLLLRHALAGPSGSGKTFTALAMACRIAERMGRPGSVAVIDTEHDSSRRYADLFEFDQVAFEAPYHPQTYIDLLKAASAEGYAVTLVDSLYHAWKGAGGFLELVDQAARRLKGNSHAAWGDVDPLWTAFVEALTGHQTHLLVTMRSKMDYVREEGEGGKKASIKKLGMAPVIRDGMEYEFDIAAELDMDHYLMVGGVGKTRCHAVADMMVSPGLENLQEYTDILFDWAQAGEVPPTPAERWSGLLDELGVTSDERTAFAALVPALPDDESTWEPAHYVEADRIARKRGKSGFEAALTTYQGRNGKGPAEKEESSEAHEDLALTS